VAGSSNQCVSLAYSTERNAITIVQNYRNKITPFVELLENEIEKKLNATVETKGYLKQEGTISKGLGA
jgi:hypothetical protein